MIIMSIGCHYENSTRFIHTKGSDTMLILMRQWAEEYMKKYKDVSIYVEGGGSALGIRALINNEVDICAASRTMLPGEVRQLAEKRNRLGIAFLVAKDALSIYINRENPVRNLSMKQLQDIFTGRTRNWREVGGKDLPIKVISRSPNSGTFLYFREHVLNDLPYTEDAVIKNTTNEIVNTVFEDESAIGYGGTAYGEEVRHCRIENVSPTLENVHNDTYPIIRYLYLYTVDIPEGTIKDFIDWALGQEGQAIVARVGFIPLWEK
jgi:phosphate transport system substrate-binding protein